MARLSKRTGVPPPLPRAPVLDWNNFVVPSSRTAAASLPPGVQDLPALRYTTSGRAAIFHALGQLALPRASDVLVPTYHCPTMIAPVILRGLRPAYFGLRADGLPDLAELDRRGPAALAGVRAMVVAHYFGLPRSLSETREWCDARGIALVEDCAHCFFGRAGERPVGSWGDFATASLSKFFPVPEAGLIGSARRRLSAIDLRAPSLKAEVKGVVDVLESAVRHRRLRGLGTLLGAVFALKNRRLGRSTAVDATDTPIDEAATLAGCDMRRVEERPLWASMALNARLGRARIVACRRAHYSRFAAAFASLPKARPLFPELPQTAAPYVFPLWVEDGDRVYHAMRALGLPVFRWDRLWPGTPRLPGDHGAAWSRHVLQLLCHQDLRPEDVERTIETTIAVLGGSGPSHPRPRAAPAAALVPETRP